MSKSEPAFLSELEPRKASDIDSSLFVALGLDDFPQEFAHGRSDVWNRKW